MSVTSYTHLLRVEAVNFSHFIFDVDDLSTVRGGGLLLLEAIDYVAKLVHAEGGRTLSSGASVGLFGLVAYSDQRTRDLLQSIRSKLNLHAEFRHATFVVNATSTNEHTFRASCERALAMNRHQQMMMAALQVPEAGSKVCSVDRIRPAAGGAKRADDAQDQSHSVNARRTAGRERKLALCKDILHKVAVNTYDTPAAKAASSVLAHYSMNGVQFAKDFRQISTDAAGIRGNLGDKIAVFYADGNKFSRFNRAATAESLSEWDARIKHLRGTLLAKLLDVMHPGEGDARIRIETLLWGGDEVLFVLPAWKGIEFAQEFFDATSEWTHNEEKLTHAVGLVFCHNNAPIQPIQALAKRLADIGKKDECAGREVSSINCVVLESFDHTGLNWDDYLKRVSAGTVKQQARVRTADEFNELVQQLKCLQAPDGLPKSRLHAYLRDLLDLARGAQGEIQRLEDRLVHDLNPTIAARILKNQPADWMLLTELWDYVDTEDRSSQPPREFELNAGALA